MRSKKIIKLPKQQMVGVAKDFGFGDCSLTLFPDWYAFSSEDLIKLLEQTFNAGTAWKEKYSQRVKLKDSQPPFINQPDFIKYLKKIT